MSGYVFNVGDRVTAYDGSTVVTPAPDTRGHIVVLTPSGEYCTLPLAIAKPLPLFEPVERWMPLDDGELDWSTYSAKGSAGRNWVKVIISPAEDQS